MKTYEKPEVMVQEFDVEDVVTTSGNKYETEIG